tara:strand:- start:3877 stop:4488 length:612 start_codon:yes stop_codon:yes gene_type:complete
MDSMNSNSQEMWDSRFSKRIYAYGKQPNAFFAKELDKIKSAGILLPGEGEGRNAVYALKKGWNVIAFDQSKKGREKALALAEENGVTLDFNIADANLFQCPVLVDVVAYSYFHLPSPMAESVYTRLNTFLTPGGHLIFEAFSTKNIGMGSGGPQTESMCFTVNQVKSLLDDFKHAEVWEEKVKLQEGLYHSGESYVIRARAIK